MKEMTIDLGRNCAKCGIENPQFSIEMKLDIDPDTECQNYIV